MNFLNQPLSDRQLQEQALATRGPDDNFIIPDSTLWGYLQPIGKSEDMASRFFDFSRARRGYTVTVMVPLVIGRYGRRIMEHNFHVGRITDGAPTILRNLSDILELTVNKKEVSKGQSYELDEADRIQFYHNGKLLYDYVYRDAFADVAEGEMYEHYIASTTFGKGAFAEVFSVVHRETRKYYAAKRITRLPKGPSYEIDCMKKLHHPNICELKEVFFHRDQSIFLVMEICRYGDLLSYIGERGYLDERPARHITFQICNAMAYSHSRGIVHRDLKPENIVMDSVNPPRIKITDFGLAKSPEIHGLLRSTNGSELYIAPEVFGRPNRLQAYSNLVDSWSVGVIVFAMLTGGTPYAIRDTPNWENEPFEVRVSKRELTYQGLADRGYLPTEEPYEFVHCLLQINPRSRETLTDALCLPWLRDLTQLYMKADKFNEA